MRKFENIDSVLEYLVRGTENGYVQFEHDTLTKTQNLLTKFVHNPRLPTPEVRSYNTPSLVDFKKRHPHNKVINSSAKAIIMFDFDDSIVYFVEFGDLNMDGTFSVEVDACDMATQEIKSDAEAMALIEEYHQEVEYDWMNDTVNYTSEYERRKMRKAKRDSEIIRMFENFTI